MPHEPASRPLQLAALLLIAALALTAALHTRLGDHHTILRAHLNALAATP